MAAPLTWRNVNIDNGSSAAAFGSNAAGFGRTALQGLDIFSDQMKDRIEREDTQLTNEAIASALSGGPKVSNNRRVDALTLQKAVETDELGNRQETVLQDDLLTSAVNRRLNTASAGIKEKDLETYDERFTLDKEIAAADAAYKATQSKVALANLEELQRQRAEAEKDRQTFDAVNAELFGPQVRAKAIAEHEAYWAENAPANATPEDKATDQAQWLENAQQEVFNNPRLIYELAQKHGTTPLKLYQGTAIGQRALEAQKAADAIVAERAALSREQQQTVLESAQQVGAGNTQYVRFDGSDYVFEKDVAVTDATFDATFNDLKVDPKDPRADDFKAKIKSRFKGASVAEQVMKEVVRDGTIPANFSQLVDERFQQVQQRALDSQKTQEYVGSSDRRVNSANFYRSIESRLPKETSAAEAANAISENPIVAAATIESIETNPQTVAERDQARDSLNVSVEGLLQAQKDVKLPKDPSDELTQLYNRFRSQVDVANGGAFVPERSTIGLYDIGGIDRPVTPKFGDRKAFAVDAATTLQQLQQLIEKETKQKEADRLRRSLD
jgi:hypothetical protein